MFYDEHSCHGAWGRARAMWMARHGGRHGFGRFGGGFMGGPGWGGGFRTGRKLTAADLQLVILALLADKPAHGYELIKALEERSGGFYSPSPGVIYPALTYLEEVGYASVEAEGAKKLYRITEEGRRQLEQNRTVADTILAELARIGAKMDEVRQVFTGEEEDSLHSGELHAARHALRAALHSKHHCPPEEARRIAQILRRAAAEILGDGA